MTTPTFTHYKPHPSSLTTNHTHLLQFEGVSKELCPYGSRVDLSQRIESLEVLLIVAHLTDGDLVTGDWKEG